MTSSHYNMNKDLNELLASNQCSLLVEKTSREELRDLDSDLPSDVHLVVTDQGVYGVRGYKSVDIFDSFHDAGHKVLEIENGYGRIKPKLFKSDA